MRKNYGHSRIRNPQQLDAQGNVLQSLLMQFRITIQLDSATGDAVTFSMSGLGVPQWLIVRMADLHTSAIHNRTSIEGSMIYLSLFHSASFGSMDATVNYAFLVTALIASR